MQPLWASACAGACGCCGAQHAAAPWPFAAGTALGGRRAGWAGRIPRAGAPRSAPRPARALSGHSLDAQVEDKRRSLLRFVQEVQPHDALDHFQQTAPLPVADAMRTTVTNLLGTLPPAFFSVTVSANVEDLAQLLLSMLMTGYMYRNAQYRLDCDRTIRSSMDDADWLSFGSEAPPPERKALPAYAAGSQLTRVSGSVLRWRTDTEQLEEVDARQYIQKCETEIASLREQLSRSMYARSSGNELLDFLRTQEPGALGELTECCPFCLEAMNSWVQRLLGSEMRRSESTAAELARVFFWALVTGYSLRQLEVKCDFEASFTVPTLPGSLE